MSVSMTRADGVTVFTLTSDPQSAWPPLCQIFKALCYSPVCCSVPQHLKRVRSTSQSVLGTLHIMIGMLNIGLGIILLQAHGSWYQLEENLFPVWFGILLMLFGSMCILSEKRPSPCLVIVNVILNLAGVIFDITAIALYSINITEMELWDFCYNGLEVTSSPACLEGRDISMMILRSINGILIVLCVMEFFVTISSVTLGIKTLRSHQTEQSRDTDPELHKPLLEEVTS